MPGVRELGPVALRLPLRQQHPIGQQCHVRRVGITRLAGLLHQRQRVRLERRVMVGMLHDQPRRLGAITADARHAGPALLGDHGFQPSCIGFAHRSCLPPCIAAACRDGGMLRCLILRLACEQRLPQWRIAQRIVFFLFGHHPLQHRRPRGIGTQRIQAGAFFHAQIVQRQATAGEQRIDVRESRCMIARGRRALDQQQFAALGERDTLPVQVTQGAAARGIVVVSILVQRREEAGRLSCDGGRCKDGEGERRRAGRRVRAYRP